MKVWFIIALCLSQAACATVVRGTDEDFKVRTQPAGAKVSTTLETRASVLARKTNPDLAPNYHKCPLTPCAFKVPRRSKFVAIIEKDGFRPVPFTVNGKLALLSQAGSVTAASGVLILAWPLAAPAIAVDAISGSTLSLTPNPLEVTLIPLSDDDVIAAGTYDLDTLLDGRDTYKDLE